MGEYTDAIERINIELSLANKLELVDALRAYLTSPFALGKTDDAELDRLPRSEMLGDRVEQALELLAYTRGRWPWLLTHFDAPVAAALPELSQLGLDAPRQRRSTRTARPAHLRPAAGPHDPRVVEDRGARAARAHLRRRGVRAGPGAVRGDPREVLRGRVFVALHMHAGDGNVHTNIPVNSDDYAMLQRANAAVARIMQLARDLDGVISGEHGIGITKLEFLTDDETAGFRRYKSEVDPEGPLQQGQAACPARTCATPTRRASA